MKRFGGTKTLAKTSYFWGVGTYVNYEFWNKLIYFSPAFLVQNSPVVKWGFDLGYLDFFSIKIACALDFPFLPFFQKANNEGHTEVDFFIYQKTVSREKSAFGKEPNLI